MNCMRPRRRSASTKVFQFQLVDHPCHYGDCLLNHLVFPFESFCCFTQWVLLSSSLHTYRTTICELARTCVMNIVKRYFYSVRLTTFLGLATSVLNRGFYRHNAAWLQPTP